MKAAILGHYFCDWAGGIDLLENMTYALDMCVDNEDEVDLLLPKETLSERIKIKAKRFGRRILGGGINRGTTQEDRLNGRFDELKRIKKIEMSCTRKNAWNYIKKNGYEIVFPIFDANMANKFDCRWIGYLYDFQHKYIPSNFKESIT